MLCSGGNRFIAALRSRRSLLSLSASAGGSIVASALDALKRQTEDRKVSLDIPDAVPLVRTDARLLHHILVNLIDNGCKYSPPSSTITIVAREDGGGIALDISNEGPGLGNTTDIELFMPFERGDNSDRKPGTGLGLAIVAGFAKALGLPVSGRNRTDRAGAVFTVRFPPVAVIGESEETRR